MRFVLFVIRHMAKRAAHQALEGRLIARGRPEQGRLLHRDVDQILDRAWLELARMLPQARLERLPTRGNRHMALLALFMVAVYHAVVKRGIAPAYAAELVADSGWKLYAKMVVVPKLVAGLLSRDPQRRINLILRMFMVYPFSAPGKPGYEVTAWSDAHRYCTFWTHCPPLQAVRDYVDRHGDRGELDAFRMSWCSYDWALTYALVGGGFGRKGYYQRPHTMSAGDDICDMCWYARPPADTAEPG